MKNIKTGKSGKYFFRKDIKLIDNHFVKVFDINEDISILSETIGYQIENYGIPDVWLKTQGEGIKIAVLDTGVQLDHPDLMDSFVENQEYLVDNHGHGTHVGGIISANRNHFGMVGVAPKSKLIAVKVLGDNGSGTARDVANGIYKSIEMGADIINMSLGSSSSFSVIHNAIKEAYNRNIVIIASAGNSGSNQILSFPGNYRETISVGALDEQRLRASFSQSGSNLDFMAPGVRILSTLNGNRYGILSGTSMSAPWLAGIVALIMSKHRKVGGKTPINNVEDVREHLKRTAVPLEQIGTGFGFIDVEKTIAKLNPGKPGQVVIIKVQGNAPGNDWHNLNEEWMQFYNKGDFPVDMTGWVVKDIAGWTYVFKEFILGPKSYAKLRTGIGEDTKTDIHWNFRRPILNNEGDTIWVSNEKNELISEYSYGDKLK